MSSGSAQLRPKEFLLEVDRGPNAELQHRFTVAWLDSDQQPRTQTYLTNLQRWIEAAEARGWKVTQVANLCHLNISAS